MEKFEKLYATLDKATKFLQEIMHNTYVDSLFINSRSLLEMEVQVDIPNSYKEELLSIYSEIDEITMSKEEIRTSTSFLALKAFKEDNVLNSELTADVAALLMGHIVSSIFKEKSNIAVIDPVVGSANLLTCVMNNLNSNGLDAVGFDINTTSIKLGQITSDLQGNKIDFIIEDFITSNIKGFNLAVFDSPLYIYDDIYFPHVLVERLSNTIEKDGYIVGLIPNDFFEVSSEIRNSILEKLKLVGLVTLSEEMFVDKKIAKSIVILKKTDTPIDECLIVTLPSFKEYEKYKQSLNQIREYFR